MAENDRVPGSDKIYTRIGNEASAATESKECDRRRTKTRMSERLSDNAGWRRVSVGGALLEAERV